MDVESVADELYVLPREEFTAARNAAVKRAREQGNRELAGQIGALRRPSTAAWVANQLVREQPDEIRALVELGDGLRAAQLRLEGEQLRQLSQQRRVLVHALVQQAQALARTAGHPLSETVTNELTDTFTAAVNSSAAAQALATGRLTSTLDPAAGTAELFAGPGSLKGNERAAAGHQQSRHDLERFRSEATDAATVRDEAQRALTDADQAAHDAVTALQELRARVEAAERAEHEARRRSQSAQRDFEAADRTARQTQQRVHVLELLLAQHQNR